MRAGRRGVVYLVGAGPGDPDLLTVRASRLLARCQVLAHDELVPEAILELAPACAERIRVGRRGGGVRHHDARIHPLVIERALSGHDVVRLKGGDPMIFGRGGEEIDELRAAGIAFEVVPGITAALGAAAALAFPLTHRNSAHAVTLRTARTTDEPKRSEDTLVFYMGLAELESICEQLIEEGRAKSTPALVVSSATRPEQRHVLGTLADVGELARDARLESPALLFVGDVVSRASALEGVDELGETGVHRTCIALPSLPEVARDFHVTVFGQELLDDFAKQAGEGRRFSS